MKYEITLFGNSVLREQGQVVSSFDEELVGLVKDMLDAMYDASGIGLAAQQIGRALMLCVVDVPVDMDVGKDGARLNPEVEMPLVLVNPEVVESGEEEEGYDEGCLSFPDILGRVVRPVSVRVRYQSLAGEVRELEARGMVARAIQHEVDHLNGVLFIDYMSSVKRMAIAGRLKRLKREGLAQG